MIKLPKTELLSQPKQTLQYIGLSISVGTDSMCFDISTALLPARYKKLCGHVLCQVMGPHLHGCLRDGHTARECLQLLIRLRHAIPVRAQLESLIRQMKL